VIHLEDEIECVPKTKDVEKYQMYNILLGDFEVQWKNLEKNALQLSGSEIFRFRTI
jgi:hypothetical protein